MSLDYITKRARREKKAMEIVDESMKMEELKDNPKECWLRIRNRLLQEGILDHETEAYAKQYHVDCRIEEREQYHEDRQEAFV